MAAQAGADVPRAALAGAAVPRAGRPPSTAGARRVRRSPKDPTAVEQEVLRWQGEATEARVAFATAKEAEKQAKKQVAQLKKIVDKQKQQIQIAQAGRVDSGPDKKTVVDLRKQVTELQRRLSQQLMSTKEADSEDAAVAEAEQRGRAAAAADAMEQQGLLEADLADARAEAADAKAQLLAAKARMKEYRARQSEMLTMMERLQASSSSQQPQPEQEPFACFNLLLSAQHNCSFELLPAPDPFDCQPACLRSLSLALFRASFIFLRFRLLVAGQC